MPHFQGPLSPTEGRELEEYQSVVIQLLLGNAGIKKDDIEAEVWKRIVSQVGDGARWLRFQALYVI